MTAAGTHAGCLWLGAAKPQVTQVRYVWHALIRLALLVHRRRAGDYHRRGSVTPFSSLRGMRRCVWWVHFAIIMKDIRGWCWGDAKPFLLPVP